MQIILLPNGWTLLLCFIVWPVLQVAVTLLCLKLPDQIFSPNSLIFRTHRFEDGGKIYDSIFLVSHWKHLLPDGGLIFKKRGYRKKRLENFSTENLNRFLVESARGELAHLLAIFPFWIFGFFAPPSVLWIMLAYAMLANIPCIIVQRYNRPRVQRLLKRIEKKAINF